MISIIKYYFMVLSLVFKRALYAIHIIIRRHVSIDEPVKELLTTRTISINERARCKYLYQMSILLYLKYLTLLKQVLFLKYELCRTVTACLISIF